MSQLDDDFDLDWYMEPSIKPRKVSIATDPPDENCSYTCGCCGAPGVIRTNSHTGNKFVGCSNFPQCKNTALFKKKKFPVFKPVVRVSKEKESSYTPYKKNKKKKGRKK